MLAFTLALLYPLAGLCAPIGRWQWDGSIPGSTASAVSVSLVLTGIALLFDVILGTPVAWYLARHTGRDKIVWEAAVLTSVLMPPLALGILLSLAFGPTMRALCWRDSWARAGKFAGKEKGEPRPAPGDCCRSGGELQ